MSEHEMAKNLANRERHESWGRSRKRDELDSLIKMVRDGDERAKEYKEYFLDNYSPLHFGRIVRVTFVASRGASSSFIDRIKGIIWRVVGSLEGNYNRRFWRVQLEPLTPHDMHYSREVPYTTPGSCVELVAFNFEQENQMMRAKPEDRHKLIETWAKGHDWKRTGGHATGMSGGKNLECRKCGWKFFTHSSIAPNSWSGTWRSPGSRVDMDRTKDRNISNTDPCPHISKRIEPEDLARALGAEIDE